MGSKNRDSERTRTRDWTLDVTINRLEMRSTRCATYIRRPGPCNLTFGSEACTTVVASASEAGPVS